MLFTNTITEFRKLHKLLIKTPLEVVFLHYDDSSLLHTILLTHYVNIGLLMLLIFRPWSRSVYLDAFAGTTPVILHI